MRTAGFVAFGVNRRRSFPCFRSSSLGLGSASYTPILGDTDRLSRVRRLRSPYSPGIEIKSAKCFGIAVGAKRHRAELGKAVYYRARHNPAQDSRSRSLLILTRRVNESLMIGDQITVRVLEVKGKQVRLGVNAPKEVPVHRKEVYERVQREMADPNK